MTTGFLLSSYLILSLIAFGLVDVGLWITGKETMSQWIILNSEQNIWIAFGWLGFCACLIFGGVILFKHWELPRILKKWFK